MRLDLARAHPGVAVYFYIGVKTTALFFPRALDPLANGAGILFGPCARDVAIFDGGHFDVKIDAIEERPGDTLAVTMNLGRTAAAFAFQVAEVSARTWVHRSDEHELGRKRHASGGA